MFYFMLCYKFKMGSQRKYNKWQIRGAQIIRGAQLLLEVLKFRYYANI